MRVNGRELKDPTERGQGIEHQITTVGRPVHARPTWFVIFAESEVWLVEQEVS
jgi:hypothetical protein